MVCQGEEEYKRGKRWFTPTDNHVTLIDDDMALVTAPSLPYIDIMVLLQLLPSINLRNKQFRRVLSLPQASKFRLGLSKTLVLTSAPIPTSGSPLHKASQLRRPSTFATDGPTVVGLDKGTYSKAQHVRTMYPQLIIARGTFPLPNLPLAQSVCSTPYIPYVQCFH